MGIQSLGWKLSYRRFRVYLREKYHVSRAYVFIGYVLQNQELYKSLQKAGFILVFKPTLPDKNGEVKGNVDADLVLQVMLDYDKFRRAVVVSSDGDFYSLVRHLYKNRKLEAVLSSYIKTCSVLLKKEAKERIQFLDRLKAKLEYKQTKRHRPRTKP